MLARHTVLPFVLALVMGCSPAPKPEVAAAPSTPGGHPLASLSPALKEPVATLVLLLPQAPSLKAADLSGVVRKVTGGEPELMTLSPPPSGWSTGFDFDTHPMVVSCASAPYANTPKLETETSDLRLKNLVEDHQGWISVDVQRLLPGVGKEEAYRRAGHVLAELAPQDATVLLEPESGKMRVFDAEMLPLLAGQNPLAALEVTKKNEVRGAATDDAEMLAAMAEAKSRWPEFVAAWEGRKPGQSFAVKKVFGTGAEAEHMWVEVEQIDKQLVWGRLANEPIRPQYGKLGDSLSFPSAQVEDWYVMVDGTIEAGGFTNAVLLRRRDGQ